MIKVAKFGGSSLADAEHFRKVKAIITADPDRHYVVHHEHWKEYICNDSGRTNIKHDIWK